MGLKLHHVKALPKVDECSGCYVLLGLGPLGNELFDKNWVSSILLEIISI